MSMRTEGSNPRREGKATWTMPARGAHLQRTVRIDQAVTPFMTMLQGHAGARNPSRENR